MADYFYDIPGCTPESGAFGSPEITPPFVTHALVVLSSTLISPREGFLDFDSGILALQFFQSARHFRRHLIKLLATSSGVQGGFEAEPIEFVAIPELPAGLEIIINFGAPLQETEMSSLLLFKGHL